MSKNAPLRTKQHGTPGNTTNTDPTLTPDHLSRARKAMIVAGLAAGSLLVGNAIIGGDSEEPAERAPATTVVTVEEGDTPYGLVEAELRTAEADPSAEIPSGAVNRELRRVAELNGKNPNRFTSIIPGEDFVMFDAPNAERISEAGSAVTPLPTLVPKP